MKREIIVLNERTFAPVKRINGIVIYSKDVKALTGTLEKEYNMEYREEDDDEIKIIPFILIRNEISGCYDIYTTNTYNARSIAGFIASCNKASVS